jgi:hypothetical protein
MKMLKKIRVNIIVLVFTAMASCIVTIYGTCTHTKAVPYQKMPPCTPDISNQPCKLIFYKTPDGRKDFNAQCEKVGPSVWYDCVPQGGWDNTKKWTNAPPVKNILVIQYTKFTLNGITVDATCINNFNGSYCNANSIDFNDTNSTYRTDMLEYISRECDGSSQ